MLLHSEAQSDMKMNPAQAQYTLPLFQPGHSHAQSHLFQDADAHLCICCKLWISSSV